MTVYPYLELVEIINNHPLKKLKELPDTKYGYLYNLSINKLLDYINTLLVNRVNKSIVSYNLCNYITLNCYVCKIPKDKTWLDKKICSEVLDAIDYIFHNLLVRTEKRYLFIEWSDGLYTPINAHEPSLPFYVDLREDY